MYEEYTFSVIVILLGSVTLFTMMRLPLAISLLAAESLAISYMDLPLALLVQQMYRFISSPSFIAILFMMLTFELIQRGGMAENLRSFADVLIGKLPGAYANISILSSYFFGCFSGRAMDNISSLGKSQFSIMKQRGYVPAYAAAVTAVSACQSVLTPPSYNMIICALMVGGVSIEATFVAGVVPSLLMVLLLLSVSCLFAYKYHYLGSVGARFWGQIYSIAKDASIAAIGTAILFLGTVCGKLGVEEAAAIAFFYVFVVTVFVRRELKLSMMSQVVSAAVKKAASVFMLLAASGTFVWILTCFRIPSYVAEQVCNVTDDKILILLLVDLVLLLLGSFVDSVALLPIMSVLLLPLMRDCGVHPVHFCIIMLYSFSIATCLPPIGSVLLASCNMSGQNLRQVIYEIFPFSVVLFLGLLLVTFIPAISLWLPRAVYLLK